MNIIKKYILKRKPFFIGILISFIGALPLGYINVINLQILLEQGNWAMLSFISGIIFIQFFVLKSVSFGANWLVKQKELLLFIDIFTIFFFLVIAIFFFINSSDNNTLNLEQFQLAKFPFILGLLLNCLNFIQWPYWSGIYIHLFRTKNLKPNCHENNIFIIGVMIGTSLGMSLFAQIGKYFLVENNIKMGNYFNSLFTILFLVLGIGQIIKLILKQMQLVKSAVKR